ncbi:hypothetical protein DFR29_11535 [Tahibacter aquaticus]|uniref:Uncharacterized protein n=1 Tax=Tahibacter aquaticus TaxID=520092 RepID=A0A4R6YPE3_9GAMM|nr:tetratricopeptide repeat protein [Tahibacter aquaticus]TDR39647.1 hypothetical protein DFR29_11535 [Tahibacter aquaticus]
MLQIATGKLFTRAPIRTNKLRGVLYTNANLGYDVDRVETAIGCLLPSEAGIDRVKAVAYEFVEKIEAEENGRTVLISSTAAPYVLDFSAVVSFALNCMCSPDYGLVDRLTIGRPGVSTRVPPGKFLRRFFDREVYCQTSELDFLVAFTKQLIGLKRKQFLGSMRAIRTYVNAIHRLADDIELAYTLMVAAVESLAQEFDGHEPDWASYDDRKRRAVDKALEGTPEETAERVRNALLGVEHTSLGRRFREFCCAHTTPAFFREEALGVSNPLAKNDLQEGLKNAYTARSEYVHALKRLPHILAFGDLVGEQTVNDRSVFFTTSGLARLMRHTIITFVQRQITVEVEPYPYHLERDGIALLPLAAEYWVGNVGDGIADQGHKKLEGLLEQITEQLQNPDQPALTDMRAVLSSANEILRGITPNRRKPFLALHVLFNGLVPEQDRAERPNHVEAFIRTEFRPPSPEALFCHVILGQTPPWTLSEHGGAVDGYFKRRGKSNGFRAPRLLEAAAVLDLAERYRAAGQLEDCRREVARAVENHPGQPALLKLEEDPDGAGPISWRTLLLPVRPVDPGMPTAEQPGGS